MGNLLSRHSGTFADRAIAGEDKWLEIEKVPSDDSARKVMNKKRSKKNPGKYAGKCFSLSVLNFHINNLF